MVMHTTPLLFLGKHLRIRADSWLTYATLPKVKCQTQRRLIGAIHSHIRYLSHHAYLYTHAKERQELQGTGQPTIPSMDIA